MSLALGKLRRNEARDANPRQEPPVSFVVGPERNNDKRRNQVQDDQAVEHRLPGASYQGDWFATQELEPDRLVPDAGHKFLVRDSVRHVNWCFVELIILLHDLIDAFLLGAHLVGL